MKAPRHSVVGRVWHGETVREDEAVATCAAAFGGRDQQQQQRRIATGAIDGSVRVWLTHSTGTASETQLLHTLDGLRAPISCVAFSPGTGDLVAAVEHGGIFKMWDLQQRGSVVRTLKHDEQHDGADGADDAELAVKLVFHPYPAALCILSASQRSIKVWDYKKRVCMCEFDATRDSRMIDIDTVSFTPDGNCVTFATLDGCLKIWEFRNNAIVATFEHRAERVRAVAYHPTELIIATVSMPDTAPQSFTVRLWSIERAVEVARVAGVSAPSAIGHSTLVFSLDGTQLVHTCAQSLNVISWSSSTAWSSKPHVQSFTSSMAWSDVLDVSLLSNCRGFLVAARQASASVELFVCKLPAPLEAFEEPAPSIASDLAAPTTQVVSYKASPTTATATVVPASPARPITTTAANKSRAPTKSRAAPVTHRTATRTTSSNSTTTTAATTSSRATRTASSSREIDTPKENAHAHTTTSSVPAPITTGLIARDRRAATDRLVLQSFLPAEQPSSLQTPVSPAAVSAGHADTVKLLNARLAHLQRGTEAKATASDLASMLDSVSRTSPDVVNTIQLIRLELQQTTTAKAQLQSCSNERLNKLLLLLKSHLQTTPRSPEAIKVVKLLGTHAIIFKSCTLKPGWDDLQRLVGDRT